MGQKFAAYNAAGEIIGFYDSRMSPVPEGVTAVEITDDQWLASFNNRDWKVVDGTFTPPTDSDLLVAAKLAQIFDLQYEYRILKNSTVKFTTVAGESGEFSASPEAVNNIEFAIANCIDGQFTPGIWLTASGNPIGFSFADLKNLLIVINGRVAPSFSDLLAKISAIQNATTSDEIKGVSL